MTKETARPAAEKETVKKETGKKDAALRDAELEGVTGAGLDSYVINQQYRRNIERQGC